jgi:hypothetical protein
LGLAWIGSPRSRIAAIKQAAMSTALRSRSSGMALSVGEQKTNRQPREYPLKSMQPGRPTVLSGLVMRHAFMSLFILVQSRNFCALTVPYKTEQGGFSTDIFANPKWLSSCKQTKQSTYKSWL